VWMVLCNNIWESEFGINAFLFNDFCRCGKAYLGDGWINQSSQNCDNVRQMTKMTLCSCFHATKAAATIPYLCEIPEQDSLVNWRDSFLKSTALCNLEDHFKLATIVWLWIVACGARSRRLCFKRWVMVCVCVCDCWVHHGWGRRWGG